MKKRKHRELLYTVIFLTITSLYIGILCANMGLSNFFSSIMKTSYALLIETAFYIMALSVIMGAFGNLLSQFGVVKLLNKIFAPLMKPLYALPGAAFLGVITTYLSDNPAIVVLAKDNSFLKFLKKEQVPCLCNLGTSFGMGLILTTFMMGFGFINEALIGNLGAIIGSIVSVRLMAYLIKRSHYFDTINLQSDDTTYNIPQVEPEEYVEDIVDDVTDDIKNPHDEDEDSFFIRFMTAMLEGGKNGVEMGFAIIPGLLFVCTIIMTLTFGPADPTVGYQGLAYEGVAVLPAIGNLLSPILTPLFGFTSPEAIAFPITSLGAVGAAMSLIPKFINENLIGGNDIAVFTAMGMCWSGYLSTHVGMMDALNHRKLISKAIFSHTVGGICAGISAHYIYLFLLG